MKSSGIVDQFVSHMIGALIVIVVISGKDVRKKQEFYYYKENEQLHENYDP